MTQFEKLLQKFIANPTSLKYSQVRKILLGLGFLERSGKGSHAIFKRGECEIVFSLHGKDVKDWYKKMTLKMLQLHNYL